MSKRNLYISVETQDGLTLAFFGRDAWALERLLEAREDGCTPIDQPAPRWSGYIYNLRKAGLVIETMHETHGGPFAGTHGRYVLRSELTVVERQSNEAA